MDGWGDHHNEGRTKSVCASSYQLLVVGHDTVGAVPTRNTRQEAINLGPRNALHTQVRQGSNDASGEEAIYSLASDLEFARDFTHRQNCFVLIHTDHDRAYLAGLCSAFAPDPYEQIWCLLAVPRT